MDVAGLTPPAPEGRLHATPRVTVLNETAARALFGDADPVGREVTSEPDLPPGGWSES